MNVGTDCGLTIAGFYYVCFSCSDGSINGFYYDPNSRYFLHPVGYTVLVSPSSKYKCSTFPFPTDICICSYSNCISVRYSLSPTWEHSNKLN